MWGHACAVKTFLGVGCPACGLTHSIWALLQGHFQESVTLHPMGVLVLLWAVNFWWWREIPLSPKSRQLISHFILAGFFVPWVVQFFI